MLPNNKNCETIKYLENSIPLPKRNSYVISVTARTGNEVGYCEIKRKHTPAKFFSKSTNKAASVGQMLFLRLTIVKSKTVRNSHSTLNGTAPYINCRSHKRALQNPLLNTSQRWLDYCTNPHFRHLSPTLFLPAGLCTFNMYNYRAIPILNQQNNLGNPS